MRLSALLGFSRFALRITRGRLAIAAVASILVGLIELFSLVLLVPIIASASPETESALSALPIIGARLEQQNPSLSIMLIVFVTVIVLQAGLSRANKLYLQTVMHDAADYIRLDLFETIGMARWHAIRSRELGDIQNTLTEEAHRTIGAINLAMKLFQTISLLLITLVLASVISWQMTGFSILVGTALFAALFPVRRKATAHGKEMTKLHESQSQTVLEFLNGLRLAKIFTAEDHQLKTYQAHLKNTRRSVVEFVKVSTLGTMAFQISAAVVAAIFVWVAIEVIALDIARLLVLILIFLRLLPRFNVLQESTQQLLSCFPAYIRYKSVLSEFRQERETTNDIDSLSPRLTNSITLNHVSVKFLNADKPALDNLSFSIAARQITAFIGASGSGKTTLADLLVGLTSPTSGEITIDQKPLNQANQRAWRKRVSTVSQDVFLLNDTIRTNLLLGAPEASEVELWEALDKAQISDLISSLPMGLETLCGDRGQRFSGGERQRIALARALLPKPDLLVLDEATSALDWENQEAISRAILALKGTVTCIVIAHGGSLIGAADSVITLENGVMSS